MRSNEVSGGGERENAAGDFDALETFAGGGEEQRGIRRGGRWLVGREEPVAYAIERRGGRRGIDADGGDAENACSSTGMASSSVTAVARTFGDFSMSAVRRPLMSRGFDGDAEQEERKAREAVIAAGGLFGASGKAGEDRRRNAAASSCW